ncbi:MAG TPA: carbamoyl phosphate synthase large subunit, partial [Kiloniellaceae bacterium]|nr:carbamoyl phosphate synthase large subunit [Kiloniellaceae bacterium]
TGEVMGLDSDFARAFLKAQLGAGVTLPDSGTVFISVKDGDKAVFAPVAHAIAKLGFRIMATGGTAKYLAEQGLEVEAVKKVREGRPHIVDAMKSGQVQLVFNTTEDAKAIADSFELRRTALTNSIPYSTTSDGAKAAVQAIEAMRSADLAVAPLQSYFRSS